jgi:release factor glutamine methyltransferase
VLKRATGHLEVHGSDSPRLDAEVLMAHSLGVRRIDLYMQFERPLTEPELVRYRGLIARRARREPVAYLVGHKEFMALDFIVTPDVLVPNPDTEVLVQRAVAIARERGGPLRAADVGTGSGCIAIALAHYAPTVEVWAGDISPDALAVAARNVTNHSLNGRVHLVEGDLLEPFPGEFDLICANLPYVRTNAAISPEVMAQPEQALFGGIEGADVIVRLLAAAAARLRPHGRVLAEIDEPVMPYLEPALARDYAGHSIHRDLGGHQRVLETWS